MERTVHLTDWPNQACSLSRMRSDTMMSSVSEVMATTEDTNSRPTTILINNVHIACMTL